MRAAGPRALRGSALRSAGYAATVALALVAAPLLIRHLGIATFGRYTTVIAIVTIVGGLSDAGLVNVALREWATRKGEDRAIVMRRLLGIRSKLSAGGVAIGVAFALLAGYSTTLVLGTLIAGIGMVLQATANVLTVPLQGELRFGWAAIIDVTRQAVSVVLIVALVLAGASLLPFFVVAIPAGLAALALTAMLVRRQIPLAPILRGPERWPLIRDTLPYAAAIAVNTVYFRVTIVVMSLIAAAEETGYFATSFRVTEVLVRRSGTCNRSGVSDPLEGGSGRTGSLQVRHRANPRTRLGRWYGTGARCRPECPLRDQSARRTCRRAGRSGASDSGARTACNVPRNGDRVHAARAAVVQDAPDREHRRAHCEHHPHARARTTRRCAWRRNSGCDRRVLFGRRPACGSGAQAHSEPSHLFDSGGRNCRARRSDAVVDRRSAPHRPDDRGHDLLHSVGSPGSAATKVWHALGRRQQ